MSNGTFLKASFVNGGHGAGKGLKAIKASGFKINRDRLALNMYAGIPLKSNQNAIDTAIRIVKLCRFDVTKVTWGLVDVAEVSYVRCQ
jgi:hypothetical protein